MLISPTPPDESIWQKFKNLLRHPFFNTFMSVLISALLTGYAVNKNLQNQIKVLEGKLEEKDKEIRRLKDSRETRIKELELEKKQYLEKHKYRLEDIHKRREAEKMVEVNKLYTRGLLAASALFGAAHFDGQKESLENVLFAMAAGLFLGSRFQRRGYHLSEPIAEHFWFDALAGITLYLADPENNPLGAKVEFGF